MDELGCELTRSKKVKTGREVESARTNYNQEYGCLLLETECHKNPEAKLVASRLARLCPQQPVQVLLKGDPAGVAEAAVLVNI